MGEPSPSNNAVTRGKEQSAQPDLKDLIEAEHRKAELERLLAGYEGCGCTDCQQFYSSINLGQFGDRVKEYAGTISILAGRTGATKWDQYHLEERWQGEVFIIGNMGYTLTPALQTICRPVTEIPKELLTEGKEVNDGKQPNIQRPGAIRSRTAGKAKHRAAHIKPASFRKRLPGNKA